jgi:hypothetical protein
MRHNLGSILAILIMCGLAACMANDLSGVSWLDYSSCNPPCWQGITPGETTLDETVTILDQLNAENVDVSEYSYSQVRDGAIGWTLPGEQGGYGEASYDDEIILRVKVRDSTCLSKIVAEYGDPTHVVVTKLPDYPGMDAEVVWLNQGFKIYVDSGSTRRGIVDDSLCASSVVFFVPAETLEEAVTVSFPMEPIPWHGYDTLESYRPNQP